MTIKTLVPQIKNTYSSFPTFTEHDNKIFVFYRQGIKSNLQCHGVQGKVKCFEIEKGLFLNLFKDDKGECLYDFGKDYIVFEGENEIDAIVSKLEEDVFSLCTRRFVKREPIKTYISISDVPHFRYRSEVKIKGVENIIFYGKAFKWEQGYVFPAYGQLTKVKGVRPLVLITEDFSSWELLSYLPGSFYGLTLNESSIISDGEKYTIFIREDTDSFGIWYSTSDDLQRWTFPKKLVSYAQAPMSIYQKGKIYLTFRELVSDDTTNISLMTPFSHTEKITVDIYEGNPYDGGYTDIGVIDDRLFVAYYTGNVNGEPYLKCCELNGNELLFIEGK
jgi:hypothetical protein